MNSKSSCLFELKNITLSYDGRPALHHISGRIERGEMLAVSGPNGSGKSSLLKLLAGGLSRYEGQLTSNLGDSERLAYLPQSSLLNTDIPVSVESVVSQGLWPNVSWGGWLRADERLRVAAALERVGMKDLAREVWADLSGGLRQRALIARLLCQDASLWLLDEPLTALDARSTHEILSLLREMNQAGKTIICVLHDHSIIEQFFPKTLMLARELKYWGDTRNIPGSTLARETADLRHGWVNEPVPCGPDGLPLPGNGARDV